MQKNYFYRLKKKMIVNNYIFMTNLTRSILMNNEKINDLNSIVCYCKSITKGDIINSVKAGSVTLESVMETTEAGTVCGACKSKIEAIINEYKG